MNIYPTHYGAQLQILYVALVLSLSKIVRYFRERILRQIEKFLFEVIPKRLCIIKQHVKYCESEFRDEFF